MVRYFLKFSFNGGAFCGWQKQAKGSSVQQWISNAVSWTVGEQVEVTGCGRTDSGVHASCFFGHVDLQKPVASVEQCLARMNQLLNDQVYVQAMWEVKSDVHARHSAISRTYEYHLLVRKNPFRVPFAWYYPFALDVEAMNRAAAVLPEYSDFRCFCKSRSNATHYLCTLHHAQWTESSSGEELVFRVKANRFLRNMVRALVGTLLEVGRSRMSLEEFQEVLQNGTRSDAGVSVPAHGLFLTHIEYPQGIVPDSLV